MIDYKKIREDIQIQINSEEVKNKITSDLNIKLNKSNKCLCFKHEEDNPSMSFDSKGKIFRCFSCGATYNIIDHYMEYHNMAYIEAIKSIVSDFNISTDKLSINTERRAIKQPTRHENNISKAMSYINKRCISENTLKYADVKEDDKGNIVFVYKNELGEHISNKYRPARKINKDKKELKMWFESETNINTLYLMDKADITKPLVICEGEFDALSLIEAGYKNAVSVPTGCRSTEWITTNWTWLEQFEEIILWYDNDEAGKEGSNEVFNRLPNKVVKIVYSDICNDINEILYKFGKSAVLKQLEKASIPLVSGVKSTKQISTFNIYEAETVQLGIRKIDNRIIGMPLGTLNVVTGRTGEGKSTILNQFFIGESIRQGYKVFLFSGELTESNAKGWLLDTLANEDDLLEFTNKKGIKYKKISSTAVERMDNYLEDKFYLYTEEDYTIKSIIAKMEIMAKRYGVKVFCIDNLMVTENDEKEELRNQTEIVKMLKSFAKKYNCIVHLVAHPRKAQNGQMGLDKSDISGSANITNLADYVMLVQRIKDEEDPTKDKHTIFSIDKDRYMGTRLDIALLFDKDRRRFYCKDGLGEELQVNYLDEGFEQIGIDSWDDI
jgi:twinkle protein